MIKWNKKLSVGVEYIDNQHKKFFDLVNRLENYLILPKDVYLSTLKELRDYAFYHFKDEEKLMAVTDYPGLEGHKKIHREFTEKIEELIEKQDIDDSFDLFDFAAEWLIEHILKTDQKYSDWVKRQINLHKINVKKLFE